MPHNTNWEEAAQQRAVDKNTHVSFPQLKYPSLRDEGLRDPVQWLAGKAMDDGAEGLWRIHDKLYDLTRFIKRHPGGEEWLELTQGTDITEAFESHHLNPSTEKILTQYYIRDAKTPRNSPFTFKEDGFYKTLKRAAFEELKKIPKDASRTANNITDFLFVSLLISSSLTCWVTNNIAVKFWYTYASFNLAVLTVACHNYIHRKTNWRMYLFNMSMWSYRDFRVSHVLSHHLYTNTLMDLELSSLEPILFYTPRKDKPLHAKLGCITEIFFFPFVFFLSFTKRFLSIFLQQGFFKSHYRWHDAIGLLLPLWMAITSGAPFLDVISMWLWINCSGSLIFFSIAVNAAHHHPDAIKDGDQPASETPDWGMHQVEALLDRKDVNGNVFAVMTLFGDHCLHHMFPTLDHSVLKYMHPLFIDLCEKYQANYRVSTQFKLVLGQIKETMRTEFKMKND
ncbi:cytochrome b5-related protein-like [Spodoptera litura]|uniref:Cytochrome b5-related protein n=1 Tax=Spodoptera litura TaxID=69820 RepID=A0A0P0E0A7_SPOLT|nr:cytochrome b5-related protein-like [Spodoptera litura]ALJ30232.1 putative desaturase des10 [Spodoptera litura]